MRYRVGAAACLALLGGAIWWLVHPPAGIGPLWTVLFGLVWVLFAAGFVLLRRVAGKALIGIVLLAGIGLPLAAGFAPQRSSDDLYRYIWDGRVQAAGIDPYRYPPAATELVPLRDDFLWPDESAWCVPPGTPDQYGAEITPGCAQINRPTVPTIYPPVAQGYFALVHLLSPPGHREAPIQLAAAALVAATTILLLFGLPRARRHWAWLWAACPLVALEAGNNAHVDVLAAFLTAAALLVLARNRNVAGGALLGLAIAAKLSPALVLPAALRRKPLVVGGAVLATVALVYLPHLLAVGPRVIGYLPGYLDEEGFTSGTKFALLTMVLPEQAATVAVVLIMAGAALAVLLRGDPDQPWLGGVALTGIALLLATPYYSWYALLLVVLVALSGRVEWLAVAAAGYLAQYASNVHLSTTAAQRLGYGIAAAVVIAATWFRYRHLGRYQTQPVPSESAR